MYATSLYKTITKLHTLLPTNETLIRRLYKIHRLRCHFTVRENSIMLQPTKFVSEKYLFFFFTQRRKYQVLKFLE